jgi:hypothetical protein
MLVLLQSEHADIMEIIRVLVEAVANRCLVPEVDTCSSSQCKASSAMLTFATENHICECIVLLLALYQDYFDRDRRFRRRAHVLQKSFIANI